MGRPTTIKPLHPELLAELRTLSDEVPEVCTPSEAWVLVRPITRRGHEFVTGSFWAILSDALNWHSDISEEGAIRIARWIKLRRENAKKCGNSWPPMAVTRQPFGQPAPWDGKREKVRV